MIKSTANSQSKVSVTPTPNAPKRREDSSTGNSKETHTRSNTTLEQTPNNQHQLALQQFPVPNFYPSGAGAKMSKMLLQGVLQTERTSTRKSTTNSASNSSGTGQYHHVKSKSSGSVPSSNVAAPATQLQAQQLIEQATASAKHLRKSSSTITNMG